MLLHKICEMALMKNLADVHIDEQRKFLKSFNHVFLDIDGMYLINICKFYKCKKCFRHFSIKCTTFGLRNPLSYPFYFALKF